MSPPSNIVVVTGTNTEIGKTVVACGLARRLADDGVDVRTVKPVESGIEELESEQRDGVQLARAAGQERPDRALRELSRPLAPPEAAAIDGVELSMDSWCRDIRSIARDAELVIVEGAGGVLSPLTWEATARELAADLSASSLLVAPNILGVLTQTLTALESLERASVPVEGVVLNDCAPSDESSSRNPETLARFTGRERVARLPPVSGWREAATQLDAPARWLRAGVSR